MLDCDSAGKIGLLVPYTYAERICLVLRAHEESHPLDKSVGQ